MAQMPPEIARMSQELVSKIGYNPNIPHIYIGCNPIY